MSDTRTEIEIEPWPLGRLMGLEEARVVVDDPPGTFQRFWDTPTVDDLIAWLRTGPVPGWEFGDISGWSGLASEPEPHPHVMLVQVDRPGGRWWTVQFHGATLFEALEAAVRKITS